MESLETLEKIVEELGDIVNIKVEKSPPLNLKGKSAKQLKEELNRIKSYIEQKKSYLEEKKKELEQLCYLPIDERKCLIDLATLQKAKELLLEFFQAKENLESGYESCKLLNEAYITTTVKEGGFESYEQVSKRFEEVSKQITNLENKFLGRLRYKSEINKLKNEEDSLHKILNTKYETISLLGLEMSLSWLNKSSSFFSDLDMLMYMIVDQFYESLYSLYCSYDYDIERKENRVDPNSKINETVLESLTQDYLLKYYKPKIEEIVGDNNSKVYETLDIIKDLLNMGNIYGFSYTDEEIKKIESIKDKMNSLSGELKWFVEKVAISCYKPINRDWLEFEKHLRKIKEKDRIFQLISKLKTYLPDDMPEYDNLPRDSSRLGLGLQQLITGIENRLKKEEEKCPFYINFDPEQFKIFINNRMIQRLYDKDTLETFHKHMRDNIFELLLSTAEHKNESVALGYKALLFKDPKSVVYNIMNFWREQGYSGEKPFLNRRSKPEDTICAEYILSLTDEQLEDIEKLKIPGLMDLINIVKKNPNKFVGGKLKEKVQNNLIKMCKYYLENGSDSEKYFAFRTVFNLDSIYEIIKGYKKDKYKEKFIEYFFNFIGCKDDNLLLKNYDLPLFDIFYIRGKYEKLEELKKDIKLIREFYIDLEDLLKKSLNPQVTKEEACSLLRYKLYDDLSILQKIMDYVEVFDSKIIQTQLSDLNYKDIFKKRLDYLKNAIFFEKKEIAADITSYLKSDFIALRELIDSSNLLIKNSEASDALNKEMIRLLQNQVVLNNDNIADTKVSVMQYLRALDNTETINKFVTLEDYQKYFLFSFAGNLCKFNGDLVSPILQETIRRNSSYQQINSLEKYLLSVAEFKEFAKICVEKRNEKKYLFDLLCELSILDNSTELTRRIDHRELDIDSVYESIKCLRNHNIIATTYLVENLSLVSEKEKKIQEWTRILESFKDGEFDYTNELHKNLEYTRFRQIIDNEKIRRFIKNNLNFNDYLAIFSKEPGLREEYLSVNDKFEIECVAEEAKILKDYILSVKKKADELGKDVIVVPNFSYGYLPTSPIISELAENGIETILGVKVGSTESHNNKEVINSRLFKGYRTRIIKEQPIMIVVDGTKHLVARDENDKAARYPDAYQGYLNQVISINDAIGFVRKNYSYAGKNEEDMERLRNSPEFKRTVEVYKGIMKDCGKKNKKSYDFNFWNTAGMDLIIRNYHKKISVVKPTDPEKIKGPTIIFCNVGLLDEQISKELKDKYQGFIHVPAYFDDSGKIINLNFYYDRYGVHYNNLLENMIKKAYGVPESELKNEEVLPELIKFVKRLPSSTYEPETY